MTATRGLAHFRCLTYSRCIDASSSSSAMTTCDGYEIIGIVEYMIGLMYMYP